MRVAVDRNRDGLDEWNDLLVRRSGDRIDAKLSRVESIVRDRGALVEARHLVVEARALGNNLRMGIH